ncbi:mitotic checkpoint regulator, MAD2B-interacting-domain-containing protein [Xylogone sp. PMI_703]|nr:mitotic checkpoint regulator, MAD2B-interacting-domain-containing protein [Xylogone sp. PMI_703]
MGLVDYSDSDASDTEISSTAKPVSSTAANKPAFQKVVDRSNPGKIRVSLPQASLQQTAREDEEPPIKRAKLGGGGFSGFNSFLPAPKRPGAAAVSAPSNGSDSQTKKVGLGVGISLKTGAAPGFRRESGEEHEAEDASREDIDTENGDITRPAKTSSLSLPPPKEAQIPEQKPAAEVKLVGKPLMFKPLSVARKPAKKKKPAGPSDGPATTSTTPTMQAPQAPQTSIEKPKRPKVSLFSMSPEESATTQPALSTDYQPVIYSNDNEQEEQEDEEVFQDSAYEETANPSHFASPPMPTPSVTEYQSLDAIAGDLNLSAAERRQLFGRHGAAKGSGISASKVINFNTDQEYLHNEELRASGQQVVHNPVRSIAPGKHSLKQLVNAAQSQREALEESFAKGKSNRAEASSRYGW